MNEPKVLHEWGDGIKLVKVTSGSPWLLYKDMTHGEVFDEALEELARLAAERSRLHGKVEKALTAVAHFTHENNALRAERDALRREAERLRGLIADLLSRPACVSGRCGECFHCRTRAAWEASDE